MSYGDREFHEMRDQFEKDFRKHFSGRLDREKRDNAPPACFYEDGRVNDIFLAYMLGFGYAKVVFR